jgi:hypothetical protein
MIAFNWLRMQRKAPWAASGPSLRFALSSALRDKAASRGIFANVRFQQFPAREHPNPNRR